MRNNRETPLKRQYRAKYLFTLNAFLRLKKENARLRRRLDKEREFKASRKGIHNER